VSGNFLLEQSLPVTVGGDLQDYAGYVGAAKFQSNTVLGYTWNQSRVSLARRYHEGTDGLAAHNRPTTLTQAIRRAACSTCRAAPRSVGRRHVEYQQHLRYGAEVRAMPSPMRRHVCNFDRTATCGCRWVDCRWTSRPPRRVACPVQTATPLLQEAAEAQAEATALHLRGPGNRQDQLRLGDDSTPSGEAKCPE
jgi:hypothetical protein